MDVPTRGQEPHHRASDAPLRSYEPPTIADLGTLTELTQGPSGTDVDGSGGAAGSSGYI